MYSPTLDELLTKLTPKYIKRQVRKYFTIEHFNEGTTGVCKFIRDHLDIDIKKILEIEPSLSTLTKLIHPCILEKSNMFYKEVLTEKIKEYEVLIIKCNEKFTYASLIEESIEDPEDRKKFVEMYVDDYTENMKKLHIGMNKLKSTAAEL